MIISKNLDNLVYFFKHNIMQSIVSHIIVKSTIIDLLRLFFMRKDTNCPFFRQHTHARKKDNGVCPNIDNQS